MKINPINVSTNYYGKQTQKPMYQSGVYEPSFNRARAHRRSLNNNKFLLKIVNLFREKTKLTPPKLLITDTQKVSERIFSKYGIATNFQECLNVAECTEKVIKIFDSIFGREFLPKSVSYLIISDEKDVPGVSLLTYNGEKSIVFNSLYHNHYFSSIEAMKNFAKIENFENKQKAQKEVIPIKKHSTEHPFLVYMHEFAHCAHFSNLIKKNNSVHDAYVTLDFLSKKQIPSAIGKFIARYELGEYSGTTLNELMAERITKDICKYTSEEGVYSNKTEPINYDNIFERKWNNRFITPQAYLDYYIQQIWNGKLELVRKAENKIEVHLKRIERKEALLKQFNFLGKVDLLLGKVRKYGGAVSKFFVNIADSMHDIKIVDNPRKNLQKNKQ